MSIEDNKEWCIRIIDGGSQKSTVALTASEMRELQDVYNYMEDLSEYFRKACFIFINIMNLQLIIKKRHA